jgi:type II secretory ATPase GspE/PulE/Tfp pilus assembly ATPase PilB-like protein
MRVDGILQEILSFPKQIHPAIISRIKIMANLKIDEKRVPQDGRITIEVNKKELDLRVSTLPTIYSEKLVIRILTKNSHINTLEGLGLKGYMLELANQYFHRSNGMFLVTGPTGSGKTTTLYAALMKVNTPQTNTITLEDPVENIIFGVNQMQVNPQAGLTFSSGLRSIVRQDPDIIMVGEIRDNETADLAVNAALTGHLVFSTLHTNNAAGAITRLVDIGVEPFLISSTVNIIIAQRLVRKVCHSCREAYTPTIEVMESIYKELEFFFSSEQREQILIDYPLIPPTLSETHMSFFRGKGCGVCRNTGYKGRTAIFEVLEMSDALRELTMKKSSEQDIMKQAVKDGMLTLMQEGILKVLEGTTTFEEVLRVAQ